MFFRFCHHQLKLERFFGIKRTPHIRFRTLSNSPCSAVASSRLRAAARAFPKATNSESPAHLSVKKPVSPSVAMNPVGVQPLRQPRAPPNHHCKSKKNQLIHSLMSTTLLIFLLSFQQPHISYCDLGCRRGAANLCGARERPLRLSIF